MRVNLHLLLLFASAIIRCPKRLGPYVLKAVERIY